MVRDQNLKSLSSIRQMFATAAITIGLAHPALASDNATDAMGREVTLACNVFAPSKIADRAHEPGFDVEILRAAFLASGVKLNTPFYPWKRAYLLAEQGAVDGLCSCSYLQEREATFQYSDQIGLQHVGFFALEPDTLTGIEKLDQASGLTVGVVAGYTLERYAKEAGLDTVSANSEDGLLALLRTGRIDVIYTFHETMAAVVKDHNQQTGENLRTHYRETVAYPYFSCLSKRAGNASLIAEWLNAGLKEIKTSGQYDAILERYGVLPSSPSSDL